MKRKVFRIVFFSVISVFFSLTLISFIFQDSIISAAMQGIRKDLRSRITIGDASFSLVRYFPYASIKLNDVNIESTKDINISDFNHLRNTKTLLKAGTLSLKINVLDLFKDKITIKQVILKEGEINILIDKKGNNNFKIFRTRNSDSKVSMKIDGIKIDKSVLKIHDLNKRMSLVNSIQKFKSEGTFTSSNFRVKSRLDVVVNQLAFGSINYISNKQFILSGKVKSKSFKSYDFKDFIVTYKNNKINIEGGFSLNKSIHLDIAASGTDLALKEMNELVPKINKTLEKIDVEGKVNFKARAKGYWASNQWPFLYGDFDVKGGKSEILKNNSIASVNLVGSFSNGRGQIVNSFLRIDSFKINSNFGDFEGKFSLSNFNKPLISLSTNFNLFLSNLNDAYKIDTTNKIDGTIIGNITADGNIDFDSLSPLRLVRLINNGNFKLSEIKYPLKGALYSITKGEIKFNPTDASANLYFSSNAINGKINVAIDNFYDGLMESMPFSASVTSNTSTLNLDNLLAINFNSSNKSDKIDVNVANLSIDVTSKQAILRGIPMKNLSAKIEKSGTLITVSQLNAEAIGGSINLIGKLEQNQNKTITSNLYATLDSINIETLFSSFNNFNQKTLTSSNIKGIGSGDIAFRGVFSEKGALDPNSVDCVSNLSITNGELIKFEPAYKLSKFIDLKELEHIKFANLKNQITIKNNIINIPAMYVASSAINLGVLGNHNFNGSYNYKIKLSLKDVLFKKARTGLKKQISQSDFENNTLLYFKIEGDSKKSKVSYDWSGSGWDITPAQANQPSTVEQKNTSKPFKVTWEEKKEAEKTASGAKPKAKVEQPQQSSFMEERKAEKKLEKKKDSTKFKLTWDE